MLVHRGWAALALLGLGLGALAAGTTAAAQGAAAAQTSTFRSTPEFQAEIAAARAEGASTAEQIAHWQRADELAGGQCAECLERLATLNFRAGDWEAAIRGARGFASLSPKPADLKSSTATNEPTKKTKPARNWV